MDCSIADWLASRCFINFPASPLHGAAHSRLGWAFCNYDGGSPLRMHLGFTTACMSTDDSCWRSSVDLFWVPPSCFFLSLGRHLEGICSNLECHPQQHSEEFQRSVFLLEKYDSTPAIWVLYFLEKCDTLHLEFLWKICINHWSLWNTPPNVYAEQSWSWSSTCFDPGGRTDGMGVPQGGGRQGSESHKGWEQRRARRLYKVRGGLPPIKWILQKLTCLLQSWVSSYRSI